MSSSPDNADDSLILCATSRLAQSLRWQDDRAHVVAGDRRWPTLNTATVAQWFSALAEVALLRGSSAALLSHRVLNGFEETLLWERVIGESLADGEAAFFDVPGMAASAAEAHELMVVWGIMPTAGFATEETQTFLRWRKQFLALGAKQGLIDSAQYREVLLALVEKGDIPLPREVYFAGFDHITPQERRLQALLNARGVAVSDWQFSDAATPSVDVCVLPEADAELRAVAQWAEHQLAKNPALQLGIVVPNLGNARDAIESVLDDLLHPALLSPSMAEAPRNVNFSLGKPLSRHPLVNVALELIAFAGSSGDIAQSRISELLRCPHWSASIAEADARAQLEALMREKIPATTLLARVLSFVRWFDDTGDKRLSQLAAHLTAIDSTPSQWKRRAAPSIWAARFRESLQASGWPGERRLSSHEYQAREAFMGELDHFAALDNIAGEITAQDAQRRLNQLCHAHVFQAETIGEPHVQVVGMLEAAGMHFDALWVVGMTDDVWPPHPAPNPLLPAELQRKAGSPNASAQVQLEFARSIHLRLLRCAPQIIFSFAYVDGAKELRPSPLLATYLVESPFLLATAVAPFVPSCWAQPIDDNLAPPVQDGEHIHGGTGLLQAQAVCPAWACFRYRLGAKELRTPMEGLDAAARGNIVHEALRSFWVATASSVVLRTMSDAERRAAIDIAIDAALDEYDAGHREAPLPSIFRALESERLQHLLGNWLTIELQRELPFSVVSTEEKIAVNIEGIKCNLRIDRIDELSDGHRIIIDYKTGNAPSLKTLAESRLIAPQLPIYATVSLADQPPAAVAFGRVRIEDARFEGIAANDGLLPGVAGVGSDKGRRVFSTQQFADWQAVITHWRTCLADIAREVKTGEASMRVADEADLEYCDVRPLLRLAERRSQWENGVLTSLAK